MVVYKPYIVVAGTDFSKHAVKVLKIAYEQASQFPPAELHVAYVSMALSQDTGASPGPRVPGFGTSPVMGLDECQAQLMGHLTEVFGSMPGPGLNEVRVLAHVILDAPALGLNRLAAELQASLILVGSHGAHGVARWLLGSVAEGVLRQASCPVLVVPPEPETLPVPRIDPPCPKCIDARAASSGRVLWCEQHAERHDRRHTYFQRDRGSAETNFPLVGH